MNPVELVLSRLKGVRSNGRGYVARCPAHDDANPSLSISCGDDARALITCFAGCSAEAVTEAIGLQMKDLFPQQEKLRGIHPWNFTTADLTRAKDLPVDATAQDKAVETARKLWDRVISADPSHPYLIKKNIRAHDLRVDRAGWLVVPLRDSVGILRNVQLIAPDGNKRFLPGGRTAGLYYAAGPPPDPEGTVILAEGAATALSVFEATGLPVVAAMSAGNLPAVGIELRKRFPKSRLVVFADNDPAGMKHATEAARETAGMIAVPPREGDDANDLYSRDGAEAIQAVVDLAAPLAANKPEYPPDQGTGYCDRPPPKPTDTNNKPSQATRLISLASDVELFHTPDMECYATFPVNDHYETWPIKSKVFRRWLARLYYEDMKTAPGMQALQDALNVLEGKALFSGLTHPVYVRLAEHNDAFYLDLANENWEVVEITKGGWAINRSSPVKFRRPRGMSALPYPEAGGNVNDLRRFINVKNFSDWVLIVAWLLAAFRPKGPYPILVLIGEQGSGKSWRARILRLLIDPNTTPLRSQPRNGHDLMIAASNGLVLIFDNLSNVEPWLSDALCRLSTGGGFSTRELYSDADEALFEAQRPVVINGIEELITRGDLLDRALILHLPPIPEDRRRSETALNMDFKAVHPKILGALLDAVAEGLRNLPATKLSSLPRMADLALWVTAAETGMGWDPGTFMKAYTGNRSAANESVLEASPVAAEIRKAVQHESWKGTASELHKLLSERVDPRVAKQTFWPKSARSLTNQLRRLAPNFRAININVIFGEREPGTGRRLILLEQTSNLSSCKSQQSQPAFSMGLGRDDVTNVSDAVVPGDECDATSIFHSKRPGPTDEWEEL